MNECLTTNTSNAAENKYVDIAVRKVPWTCKSNIQGRRCEGEVYNTLELQSRCCNAQLQFWGGAHQVTPYPVA